MPTNAIHPNGIQIQPNMLNVLTSEGVKGDGIFDDTVGLQAAIDSRAGLIYLPKPKDKYIISKTLVLHSGQTIYADRSAVIQLADRACAHMLTNSDHANGNEYITIVGGIWDGNNATQTCEYHENGGVWQMDYDPKRYLGVLMQFNNVANLNIHSLTLKDPESFGMQLGNLEHFTIEDIAFDYNLLKLNMDGVHLHGNCHHGVIRNLKGATNDDLLALNADDGWMFEMSRGAISDIEVDGIFAENGYTAVRLLSAGSKISRIRLSNIYGSYRYYAVSLTQHDVHPGEPSVFEEILIDGLFCTKSSRRRADGSFEYGVDPAQFPLVWFASGTTTNTMHICNIMRNEGPQGAPADMIKVDEGAAVGYLLVQNATVINRTGKQMEFLSNQGEIDTLKLENVYEKVLS